MCKFRIIVILSVAALLLFAKEAMAADSTIKTETETKSQIILLNSNQATNQYYFEGVMLSDNSVAEKSLTEEEQKNGFILEKWKVKQADKWFRLPKESFIINASAYTASADECGNSKGITASGIKVHKGTIACPPEFPFGAKLEIEGYGTYTCEDRGGAIKGNKVDIYVPTKSEAFAFGRQNLTAKFVE